MNLQDNAVNAAEAAEETGRLKRLQERTDAYNRIRAGVVAHVQRKLNLNIDPPWQPDEKFLGYWNFVFDTVIDGVQLRFIGKEEGTPPNRVVVTQMYAIGKPTINGEVSSPREFWSLPELGKLIQAGDLFLVEETE